jgi:hypothetical protein
MRVQASLQFSCATTGRNLETQLITDTRNLVIFQRSTVPMRCAFCGLKHYWRLIKYHRHDIPDVKHQHNARSKKRASRLAPSSLGAINAAQKDRPKKNRRHSGRPPS